MWYAIIVYNLFFGTSRNITAAAWYQNVSDGK